MNEHTRKDNDEE